MTAVRFPDAADAAALSHRVTEDFTLAMAADHFEVAPPCYVRTEDRCRHTEYPLQTRQPTGCVMVPPCP